MITQIGTLVLDHPIMVAAGMCKSLREVGELARSASAAIVVGSITVEARSGNPGRTFWTPADRSFSLNSIGLLNGGIAYYGAVLPQMREVARRADKPLILSIAGFNPVEYAELFQLAVDAEVDAVELNLGCPNVWDGGTQKRIASFDPSLIQAILEACGAVAPTSEPVVLCKMSPYSDPVQLADAAAVINKSALPIGAVVTMNTMPNSFAFDGESPAISVQQGLAGLAGDAIKPIALGQVMQWRDQLREEIPIIGVGGIRTGQDVREYLRAGASAVQVGTRYYNQGLRVFSELLDELLEEPS